MKRTNGPLFKIKWFKIKWWRLTHVIMSMNNSKENAEVITSTELLKLDRSNIVFEGQTELDENFDYSVFYSIHNKFYEVKQNMYDFVKRSKK